MLEFLFDPNSPFVWIIIISILAGAIAVISRPFSSYIQFVYPNAKYEAMGNPYIQKGILEKLVESDTLEHFIDQVNMDKDYTLEGKEGFEIQQNLDEHLFLMIQQMKKDNGKKMQEFFSIYIERKNNSLLKEILRNVQQKTPIDDEKLLLMTKTPKIKQFIRNIKDASEESIPEILSSFGFDKNIIHLVESDDTVPMQIDVAIDSYYLKKMESVKVPYKCKDAKHEYLARLTDILSIQHLIRAKHMNYHETLCNLLYLGDGYEILSWKFSELCKAETVKEIIESLDGTSYYAALKQASDKDDITKSVQTLITTLDRQILSFLRNISQQYYVSIGPTLRFLMSREAEITNLKIISKGISEHISSEHIAPLLIMEVPT
ncbi:hypothetical protein B6U98_02465 [Thermoplasmatales archaeon ex4572_165]|nr:MAG: hypothetical protein B6U98_02465 [Thermoplasmatales archaeon ex4572_165]RLF59284.1 MAG: hypothetical protein DRN27_03090 [Thermoplasmata archaeon]